jgi:hypothetical protein
MKPIAALGSAYYKQTRVSFLGYNIMWSNESLPAARFMLVSCLACPSALKIVAFSCKLSPDYMALYPGRQNSS